MKSLLIAATVLLVFISFEAYAVSGRTTCTKPGRPSLESPADGSCETATSIDLEWSSVSNGDRYHIYITDETGAPTHIDDIIGTSHTWENAQAGKTYNWKVKAEHICSGSSRMGNYSISRSFVTGPAQATTPNPPNGQSEVGIDSVLQWVAADGATDHDVYIGTSEPNVTNATTGSLEYKGRRQQSQYDPELDYDTTYYWRIDEVRNDCIGVKGAVWSFETTSMPIVPPPAAPDVITAEAVPGYNTRLDVSWGNVDDETSYILERKQDEGGVWGNAKTFGTDVIGYTDTDLLSSQSYYYRVKAGNSGGYSDWTTTSALASPCPTNPSSLEVMEEGENSITLDWGDNTESDLKGYNVYRRISGGDYTTPINPFLITSSSDYIDSDGLENGITYFYVVKAVDNSDNESGLSSEVSATPQDLPPAAPANLTVNTYATGIVLHWDKNNTKPDFSHYNVYRATIDGGPYVLTDGYLMVFGAQMKFYDDTVSCSVPSITYYYVVTAVDTGGNESVYSNQVSASLDYYVRNLSTGVWYLHLDGGIEAANNSDVLEATAGRTYFIGGYIDVEDKKITLISSDPANPAATILQDEGEDEIFKFLSNTDFTLTGFTLVDSDGGIYSSNSSTLISNCIFRNNNNGISRGAAAQNTGGGHMKLVNCTFEFNTGSSEAVRNNAGSEITIIDCTFSEDSIGGFSNYGTATLSDCTFTNNAGVALFNDSTGSLTATNCKFLQNQETALSTAGTAELLSCVFTGNASTANGGAIDAQADTQLTNCTITNNQAVTNGGGIYVATGSQVTLNSCILYDNTSNGGSGTGKDAQIYLDGGAKTVTYSCVKGWDEGGVGNTNADPVLDADGYHLQSSSIVCIDAGDPGYISDEEEKDIDGDQRLRATVIDMGADEYGKTIYVDAGIVVSGNGTSWSTAYKYLQDALNPSNCEAGDEIWVADGTYYPDEDISDPDGDDSPDSTFQLISKVALYGGFAGANVDFEGETNVSQRNLESNETKLSGDIDYNIGGEDNGLPHPGNTYHVVTGADCATINGFMICGGYANGTGENTKGGGMYNNAVSPVILNCHFFTNYAASNGGGLYNGNSSSPLLSNCLFSGNAVEDQSNGKGGAIYNEAGSINFINCTISNNIAYETGGIYNDNTSTSILHNCILWDNRDNTNDTPSQYQQIRDMGIASTVTYSCIQDTAQNDGSIPYDSTTNTNKDIYPEFVDPGHWDLFCAQDSRIIQATVRDFRAYHTVHNYASDPDYYLNPNGGHIDFQNIPTTGGTMQWEAGGEFEKGIVGSLGSELGDDGKPEYALNPETGENSGDPGNDYTHGKISFDQWYRDIENVNRKTSAYLELEATENPGEFVYENSNFYLIDEWGFGHEVDGKNHNYHFTVELRTTFYWDGQESDLRIHEADDDLFIFINKRLVIDIGGVHSQREAGLKILSNGNIEIYDNKELDGTPTVIDIGLSSPNTYDFDLFFAERHSDISHLKFYTTIDLDPNFTEGDYHLKQGSPCIDAGDNYEVPLDVIKDLDGRPRLIDDPATEPDTGNGDKPVVDMGAYEYDPCYTPVWVYAGEPQTTKLPKDTVSLLDAQVGGGYEDLRTIKWSASHEPFGCVVDFDPTTLAIEPTSTEPNPTVKLVATDDSIFQTVNFVTFTLQLEASDTFTSDSGEVSITLYPYKIHNMPPDVNAGSYDPIDVGYTLHLTDASVHDDGLPTGWLEFGWEVVSFPTYPTYPANGDWYFDEEYDAGTVDAKITFTQPGPYRLRLWADDGPEYRYSDTIITVEGTANKTPVAYAGGDRNYTPDILNNGAYIVQIDSPFAYVKDDRIPSEPTSELSYTWQIVGPAGSAGGATINPVSGKIINHMADTEYYLNATNGYLPEISFTKAGDYILSLTVTDGKLEHTDHAIIRVEEPPYADFSVDAGEDQLVILPDLAPLDGTITINNIDYTTDHPDVDVEWRLYSGLGEVIFDDGVLGNEPDNDLLDTRADFSEPGTYILELSGNFKLIKRTSKVTITVYPGTKITGGEDHSIVLDTRADAWAAGAGPTGTGSSHPFFKRVKGENGIGWFSNLSFIDAGWYQSLAVDRSDYAWAWGSSATINGTGEANQYPKKVLKGEMTWSASNYLENILKVAAGRSGSYSLACDREGNAWAWGYSESGQLGTGDNSNRPEPARVVGPDTDGDDFHDLSEGYLMDILDVDAAIRHSIAKDSKGHIWTWGSNSYGELGDNSRDQSSFPVQVVYPDLDGNGEPDQTGFLENVIDIAVSTSNTSYAVDKDGHVWAWGSNSFGLLGIGSALNWNDCPVRVRAGQQNPAHQNDPAYPLSDIISISAGSTHVLALERNGRVWAWGSGAQLGAGDLLTSSDIPVQVRKIDQCSGYLTDVQFVDAGYVHSMAIDKDGNYWSWGNNGYDNTGLLGLGHYLTEYYAQIFGLGGVHNKTKDIWYSSIQTAIDEADPENEIVVYPDTYYENIDLGSINLTITSVDPFDFDITSDTVIDGSQGSGDVIRLGSGNTSTISGFTIRNAKSGYNGIYCRSDSSPTITHNIIHNNQDNGIECYRTGANLEITNNIIHHNGDDGGASNCGGIYLNNVNIGGTIRNNTIVSNYDYGIYRASGNDPTVLNCIIHNSDSADIYPSSVFVNNCAVGGGTISGANNQTSVDTMFVSMADPVDYHLTSLADGICINKGSNSDIQNDEKDIDGHPRILGGLVDIGVDEYPPYIVIASDEDYIVITISETLELSEADVTGNGLATDITNLTFEWSKIDGPDGGTADFGGTENELEAQATFDKVGIYVLMLEIKESGNVAGRDFVTVDMRYDVLIESVPESIEWPTNDEITLNATITGDGPDFDYIWLGPVPPYPEVTFTPESGGPETAGPLSTTATFTEPAIYTLGLALTEAGTGRLVGEGEVRVLVGHQQVEVIITADHTEITWPNNSVNLSATILGGEAASVEWMKPIGGEEVVFFGAGDAGINSMQTPVTFTQWSDSDGFPLALVAYDEYEDVIGVGEITIVVNEPETLVVEAGEDKYITWPQNFAFLKGEVLGGVLGTDYHRVEWYGPYGVDVTIDPVDNLNTKVIFLDDHGQFPGDGSYEFAVAAIYDDGHIQYTAGYDKVSVILDGHGSTYTRAVEAKIICTSNCEPELVTGGSISIGLRGDIKDNVGGLVDPTKTEWICCSNPEHISFSPDPPIGVDEVTVTFTAAGEHRIGLVAKKTDGTELDTAIAVIQVFPVNHGVVVNSSRSSVTLYNDATVNLSSIVDSRDFDWADWTEATGTVIFSDKIYDFGAPVDDIFSTATAEFTAVGTFYPQFVVKAGGENGTVVGSGSVSVRVNSPDVITTAKAGATQGQEVADIFGIIYPDLTNGRVYFTGEHTTLSGTTITYEWECTSCPPGLNKDNIIPDNSTPENMDSFVDLDNVSGPYTFQLCVKADNEPIGYGDVKVVLLSGEPYVNTGHQYPTFTTNTPIHLNQAYVLDDDPINTDYITWLCELNSGAAASGYTWDPADTHAVQPKITFTNEGIYKLTITYDDQEYDPVSDSVVVQVINGVFVEAGAPKTAIPFKPIRMDAWTDPSYNNLLYKWTATSVLGQGNATFINPGNSPLPGDSILQPDVMFDMDDTYTLTLTASFEYVIGQTPVILGSDEVEVVVSTPDWLKETTPPVITSATINGTPFDLFSGSICDLLNIEVEAEDEHMSSIYLELDGTELLPEDFVSYHTEVLEGLPDTPYKMKLKATLDTHSLSYSASSRTLTAYAKDRAGNLNDPVSPVQGVVSTADFTTSCTIYQFDVEPKVITSSDQTLEFTADLSPTFSGDWTLEAGPSYSVTKSTDPLLETGVRLVEDLGLVADGSDNGTYEAQLTANVSGDVASVYFAVDVGYTSSQLIGQFNGAYRIQYDDYDVPLSSKYVINGKSTVAGFEPFDIVGKAYHPDFSDVIVSTNPEVIISQILYKVILSNSSGLNKNITFGSLDESGFANRSVGDSSSYGKLATIDPTSLENGQYTLTLVTRCHNKTVYDEIEIILDCPLKLGNVKFSQEDVVINVGGIPIRVVRSYDSFKKDQKSDFGYGWTYSLANMDIKLNESRIDHDNWTERTGDPYNRDVAITLPNGERATFTSYWEDFALYGLLGIPDGWELKYDHPDNFDGTFYAIGNTTLKYDPIGGLSADKYWENHLPLSPGLGTQASHDFEGYVLITQDGDTYKFSRYGGGAYGERGLTAEDLGIPDRWFDENNIIYYPGMTIATFEAYGKPYLDEIVLASGEKIDFIVDVEDGVVVDYVVDPEHPKTVGIVHYLAGGQETKSIGIVRDPDSGLITEIRTPEDNAAAAPYDIPSIQYEYTPDGRLWKVYKLVDRYAESPLEQYEITTYEYSGRLITKILDPRGLAPIQYLYDEAGKLIGTIDAKGNEIKISHAMGDPLSSDGAYESVTDRSGNTTKYFYDDLGNVTIVENPLGNRTLYDYMDEDSPDKPTTVTRFVPDPATGEPVASVTENRYDNQGRPVLTIGPEGNATETEYDYKDNAIMVRQWRPVEGGTPSFPANYPQSGTPTDYEEVSTTRSVYDDDNRLIFTGITTSEIGSLTWLSVNVNYYEDAKLIKESVQIDVGAISNWTPFNERVNGTPSHSYQYADYFDGIISLENPSYHAISSYSYIQPDSDSYDQPSDITDPAGQAIYFRYDDNNRQIASWYIWDNPSGGQDKRAISITEYDSAGRVVISRRVVDDTYGNIDDYLEDNFSHGGIESNVVLSQTTYNSIGKVEKTYDELDNYTEYDYDELGNLVETRSYDSEGTHLTTTQNLYDVEGRVIVTTGPFAAGDEPVGTETVYDALGRVVETRRWSNVAITTENIMNGAGQTVGLKSTGWTSEGLIPTVAATVDYPDTEIGPLSYTRMVYDSGGRVKHSVVLGEPLEVAQNEYETYESITTHYYDKAGKQTEVIDPDGHQDLDSLSPIDDVILFDGEDGQITAKYRDYTDFDDTEVTGNLTGDHKTVTTYEGTRRQSITDARTNETEFTYDALSRLITTKHPQTEYYNKYKDPTPDYETGYSYTHVAYDGLGRKKWQSSPIPQQFDTPVSVPDAEKREFEYDVAGRLIATVLPEPENGAGIPRYDYFYDDYGNMVAIWDPLQRLTVLKYNELSQQTHKYEPFEYTGTINTAEDIYAIDLTGKKFEQRQYDEFSRLEKVKDYADNWTVYEYASAGCGCSGIGKLKAKYFYEGDEIPGNLRSQFDFTYDNLGRKITDTITEFDTDGFTPIYTRCYENVYNEEDQIDSVNVYSSFASYEIADPPIDSIGYGYNSTTGRKELVLTPDHATTQTQVDYNYDQFGRLNAVLVEKRNGLSVTELSSYDYNPVGSRKSITYANNNYTEYEYDAMNRLTDLTNWQTTAKSTPLSSFTYKHYANGIRREVAETVEETRKTFYEYDNLNRLTKETANTSFNTSDEPTGDGYTAIYSYDNVGNRLGRELTILPSNAKLYTKYEYSEDGLTLDDQDRLFREIHSDSDILSMVYAPDGLYYAHAGENGIYYTKASSAQKIGLIEAWFRNLPSSVSHWLLGLAMAMLVVAFFIPVLVQMLIRIAGRDPARMPLSLRHRCLSVLIAYVMLVSPAGFEQLAQASILYGQLTTGTWGQNDRTIEYGSWDGTGRTGTFTLGYDANGSVTKKITWDNNGTLGDGYDDTKLEEVTYEYNLQNRLSRIITTANWTTCKVTEYKYNVQGIRVEAYNYQTDYPYDQGATRSDEVTTDYLIDAYNHTGYAQVFEETTGSSTTAYIIGDDVLAQATGNTAADIDYLLYDGHGSTRQLSDNTGALVTDESYSYDGYGVMLGGNPTTSSPAGTNLLYAGEHFDTDAQQYYLRARWYNPNSGLFNRMDPYSGSPQDPQSLHKYLYCYANPVNSIDPSGKFTIPQLLIAIAIIAVVFAIVIPIALRIRRRIIAAPAERFLAEVRSYMESNGWHDVGPDMGPDNALAHAVANINAVGSGLDPEVALRSFQIRERGEALHTQMDRANNIAGNWLAQQYQQNQPRNPIIYYLKFLELTWIEDNQLVTGTYPSPAKINNLSILIERYW